MHDSYGVNKVAVSQNTMVEYSKPNLTDKINSLVQNVCETKSIVNEISYKLFDEATPKIIEGGCIPGQPSIENTINNLQTDTLDIKRMLNDILAEL